MIASGHERGVVARCADAALAGWLRVPRVCRWLAPLAVMALLWWSSSRSPQITETSDVRAFLHNGAHVVAYAALAAATWLAWPPRLAAAAAAARAASIVAMLVAIGYGIVDELHQSHVPGRTCSASDVLTDALGALLAVFVLRVLVGAARMSALLLCGLVLACAGSVALATWGDW